MRIAYSYMRFSSLEQGKGGSERRQTEGTERWGSPESWCVRNGYTLDDRLRPVDRGRSGFHGRHVAEGGGLARFLQLIKAGVVAPGAALIIENLDRLSRMDISRSMDLAREILLAGVDIVTLLPEQVYTKRALETDAMVWMQLVWHFQRAHEESRLKSERSKDNWAQKRKAAGEGKVVTPLRAFWLDVIDAEGNVVTGRGKGVAFRVNAKAEIVRQVFRWADDGHGCHTISKLLVDAGWRFGRAQLVTQTVVWRLLQNRAVLGEYQPHLCAEGKNKRIPTGPPVEGYFPAVIDVDLFRRVQAKIDGRRKRAGGAGRKSSVNLFGGLLIDGRDRSPVYVARKGRHHYLISYHGMCARAAWIGFRYDTFERCLLRACREISPESLAPATPEADTVRALEAQLAELLDKAGREELRLEAAEDEAEEEVCHKRLARLVRQRKQVEIDLEAARARVSTQPVEQMRRLHTLLDALEAGPGKETDRVRTLIRGLVASMVARIVVYIQRKGKYLRRCWAWVIYHDGRWRKLYIGEDGVSVTVPAGADEELSFVVVQPEGWE